MRKILSVTAVAFSLACLMSASVVRAAEGEASSTATVTPTDTSTATVTPMDTPTDTPTVFVNLHRLGLGVNYWYTIDDIDVADIDGSGFSYIASYQYAPLKYVKIEVDLEYYPELAKAGEPAWAPKIFVTAGGLLYVGVGTGIYYHDGDWGKAPFYVLRGGIDFPVAPRLFLDINVNYRFNDWHTLNVNEDLKTNSLYLGAALRFTL